MMNQNLKNHPWAGIGGAEYIPKQQDNYLRDGVYHALIRDVKKKKSERPQTMGQESVIIELVIMEVVVDKGTFTTPGGETMSSNYVGEVITVHVKMSWGKQAIRLLTAFITAAAEIGPNEAAEIDEATWLEFAEKCCHHFGDDNEFFNTTNWEEQPLKGKGIKITGETTLTKETKKDFTKIKFEPWPREEDNE